MKKIIVQQEVEVMVPQKQMQDVEKWEASDGTMFDTELKCKAHETTLRKTEAERRWKEKWTAHPIAINDPCDDPQAFLLTLNDSDEYEQFIADVEAIDAWDNWCNAPDHYPCKRILLAGNGVVEFSIWNSFTKFCKQHLCDYIKRMRKVIEQLIEFFELNESDLEEE